MPRFPQALLLVSIRYVRAAIEHHQGQMRADAGQRHFVFARSAHRPGEGVAQGACRERDERRCRGIRQGYRVRRGRVAPSFPRQARDPESDTPLPVVATPTNRTKHTRSP